MGCCPSTEGDNFKLFCQKPGLRKSEDWIYVSRKTTEFSVSATEPTPRFFS